MHFVTARSSKTSVTKVSKKIQALPLRFAMLDSYEET